MRLFFAVELPQEIRDSVFEAGRELAGGGVSRTKKENLHITLKFIGERNEQEAEEIIKRVRNIEFKPFSVKIAGIGAFPSERNARVVWAGAHAEETGGGGRESGTKDAGKGGGLEELAHKIEEALGIKKENFTGHITIARVRERRDLGKFFARNGKREFGEFEVREFCLKKSTLNPQGAVYENVKEFGATKGEGEG